MLHVLSIDWDYFIDADVAQRLQHFPDVPNEKYPPSLQNYIWTSRYAGDDELLNIGVIPAAYALSKTLRHMDIPNLYICDSHTWAYAFIAQHLAQAGTQQVDLLNIDYHHDCRKNTEPIDCGNWLSALMETCRGKWRWLGWKDSCKQGKPRNLKFLTAFQTALLTNVAWDVVFICRSGMWSPPHLDKTFTELFRPLTVHSNGQIEKGIWDSRYDNIYKDIQAIKNALAEWKTKNQRI